MNKRTYNHRNFIGGFLGAVAGLAAFWWLHPIAGGVAGLVGFVGGFSYDCLIAAVKNAPAEIHAKWYAQEDTNDLTVYNRCRKAAIFSAITLCFISLAFLAGFINWFGFGLTNYMSNTQVIILIVFATTPLIMMYITSQISQVPDSGSEVMEITVKRYRELGPIWFTLGYTLRMLMVMLILIPRAVPVFWVGLPLQSLSWSLR